MVTEAQKAEIIEHLQPTNENAKCKVCGKDIGVAAQPTGEYFCEIHGWMMGFD